MKVFLRIVLFCFLVGIGSSCKKSDDPKAPEAPYTILCYLSGNEGGKWGNLDRYLKQNLVDMCYGLADKKKAVQVLVYYRAKVTDEEVVAPTIYSFSFDGYGKINGKTAPGKYADFAEVLKIADVKKQYPTSDNSMYPKTMGKVLSDLKSFSQKNKYVLIMGTHATGWLKGKLVYDTRSFGNDNGYSIDLPVFHQVLEQHFNADNLECLFLDACMMGTAEVAYEMRDITKYFLFSVMETPIAGYPYEKIIPLFLTEKVNYQEVCDQFKAHYVNKGLWGTSAAVKASAMGELAGSVRTELNKIKDTLKSIDLESIQQYGIDNAPDEELEWADFSYDIADFFRVANHGTLPVSIYSALNNAVIAKSVLSGEEGFQFRGLTIAKDKFSGIGMYLPMREKNTWNDFFKTLQWYSAAGWNIYYPL